MTPDSPWRTENEVVRVDWHIIRETAELRDIEERLRKKHFSERGMNREVYVKIKTIQPLGVEHMRL
jgi:hypothetical protein